jgi:hypothetical protein
VIDAEYGVLRKDRSGNAVEFARRGKVTSEGFFDDDTGIARQAGRAQRGDDGGE